MLNKLSAQYLPKKFQLHEFEYSFKISNTKNNVFSWLCRKETFTSFQIPPYKVEFVAPHPKKQIVFQTGVQTNHHGPLLNLPGIIGEVRAFEYRDLQYYYGSYVISFRLIRPVRLEFWFEESHGSTLVRIKLSSYVRHGFGWLWTFLQNFFWPQFSANLKLLNLLGCIKVQ